jgi:RNA polymerase sigma-70 factor (ECF subfamily)
MRYHSRVDREAALAALVARAARPELPPPDDAFKRHVLAIVEPEEDLAVLHASDLYLAFLCGRGEPRAIELLVRDQLADTTAIVARQYHSAAIADDVRQKLSADLLVAPEGAPRGIERYRGRGSLRAWLRVIGLREALRLADPREGVLKSDDDALFERTLGGTDHVLLREKAVYRALFREGFGRAVASLSYHERLLLKQHFCDELTLDEIARAHQVHRATAARQLAKVRDQLFERTRAHLESALGLDHAEFAQLIDLIASQLDASLGQLLRA